MHLRSCWDHTQSPSPPFRKFYLNILTHPQMSDLTSSTDGDIDPRVHALMTHPYRIFYPVPCTPKAYPILGCKERAVRDDVFG